MKAIILAAGKGLRMRPLTEKIPKALIEVKGRSFLERAFDSFRKAGIREVGVIVGYRKEMIVEQFGSFFKGVRIAYIEQEKPLGTADAVLQARDFTEGKDFICVNGDLIFEPQVIESLKASKGFDAVLIGRKVPDPWNYGVLEVQGSTLKSIVEKPERGRQPSNLINSGVYRFSERIFEAIQNIKPSERNELEVTDAINWLAVHGKVEWIPLSAGLLDISTPEQLIEAEKNVWD
ncbi:MAG: sugar phosphate nucleotidyltransferase [Candidatus Diapherotrites archaeon]